MNSTMSELYADIGNTACGSRAVSRAPSMHVGGGDDVRSLRSTRKGGTRSDAGSHSPAALQLVVWLARASVLAGASLLVGRNEWVQAQVRSARNKGHLGTEMNTGGKTAVPNGLEIFPESTTLVW
jgi:hypothetical protein